MKTIVVLLTIIGIMFLIMTVVMILVWTNHWPDKEEGKHGIVATLIIELYTGIKEFFLD